MGAALTYLLLELEGVDTEPDILDDGKKGPWTIFTNADCAEQFHTLEERAMEHYSLEIQQLPYSDPKGLPPPLQTHHSPTDRYKQ
eukprot:scaffold4565_cov132-Isochrysis_galbana.AAC.1